MVYINFQYFLKKANILTVELTGPSTKGVLCYCQGVLTKTKILTCLIQFVTLSNKTDKKLSAFQTNFQKKVRRIQTSAKQAKKAPERVRNTVKIIVDTIRNS